MGEPAVVVSTVARSAVGLVFLVAAASKLWRRADRTAFRDTVAVLLPPTARRLPVPASVIGLELCVPVALFASPRLAPLGFVVALALLAVFVAALQVARARGLRVPCRCFGAAPAPAGVPQIVRNAVLAAVAVAGLLAGTVAGGAAEPATLAAAAGAGVVVAVVFVTWDDLALLFVGPQAGAPDRAK